MPLRRFDAPRWRRELGLARRLNLGGTDEQRESVAAIVRAVALRGDAALVEYSSRFDGWAPPPGESWAVSQAEMQLAAERLPADQLAALEFAAQRIRAFHAAQTYADVEGPDGLQLLTRPVRRAGLYAPGGRAAYPSTVLMAGIPARVAGVQHVALATPPNADGRVPDAILAAAVLAGVDSVYRLGGAQAIAALAYGSETVQAVDVIAGPGNIYVALAKREVFGTVGVDGVAGPTEILVIADGQADATLVAADLASQLEHDPLAWAVLLTDSAALADAVEEAFSELQVSLERADVVAAGRSAIVLTTSLEESVELANEFAPEHLQILAADPEPLLARVENAGAVFVGSLSPVSLGDYVIGTNHTLPTAGSARHSSPLGVYTFLKRTSVARLNEAQFRTLEGPARTLARLEGLTAHAHAIALRTEEE
ncbi:MAG: histidinol dehydrogenase [Candidatus Dormibacteraeota bacterium]|uniref:Histidinol dehydrogenase n=1 Tax=Candidatus Dormiibacter inghamiae TaxID=3127013 RepID=A0A934K825_9BACT|nr:histidinol dehydrogenase [Candidatus Dormibacteraeota bacterium]MBJ7605929.1 histidinol dehydrogenase [Candidatus Dormibacteraeota bacterium]